ncbi:acyltransferase domain-containing protein [Micromonospora thermarum]|uniref:Acyltransferase domain-containing protein n=1 Tax=Micromonospora thermarum TaxID=2720024 RepID=A0ABX0Z749_9ACTN|nr:acyltransferase domain-containing protein [Micromonospora thermarum]NJP31956.1 acyltransferase domain-containing protein [Micromonospora thermarum]
MGQRVAFMFPGQGAYLPGAFAKVDCEPVVHDVLQTMDERSVEYWGDRVSPLLLETDAPRVDELLERRPQVLQLAILATSTIVFRLLGRLGIHPDVVVGHSLGEYSALVAAGMLTLDDAARALCERDRAFLEVSPPPGGLLATELGPRRAEGLLTAMDDWGLALAVFNGPRQTVVSGRREALGRLEKAIAGLDLSAVRLKAPYAFHNPMLRDVAQLFRESGPDLAVASPRCRVYSPILSRYISSRDDIRELSESQFTSPVRFYGAMQSLHSDGVEVFVECGARNALTKLVRACLPTHMKTIAPLTHHVTLDGIRAEFADEVSPASSAPMTLPNPLRTAVSPVASLPEPLKTAALEQTPRRPGVPSVDDIISELRKRYAASLEYPEKYLTEDADLEADLGVDSLKQTELLRQTMDHYEDLDLPSNFRISDFPTLRSLAEYLHPRITVAAVGM